MEHKRPIPTDPITGLSYPFVLLEPPSEVRAKKLLRLDYHHLEFEHMNPLLCGPAGRSVRYSAGQLMSRWQHNLIHLKGAPPALPTTEDACFRSSVFGVARLMGPLALDISREEWWDLVEMSPEQYRFATDPLRMYTEDAYKRHGARVRTHIGKFYAHYILSRDLSHIQPKPVKEFLKTENPVRKKELGNWLLSEAIDVAIQPLKPLQQALLEHRPIQGPRVDLRRAVRGFFNGYRFAQYYGELSQRLGALSWIGEIA